MQTALDGWGGLFDRPVFVLTADQDWAPEWAVERFLQRVLGRKLPLHIFRTNPSPGLDAAAAAGAIGGMVQLDRKTGDTILNSRGHDLNAQGALRIVSPIGSSGHVPVLLADQANGLLPRVEPCPIGQGWHPNFQPGSSHGRTCAEVIDYCRTRFPGARTARSHTYAEDSYQWLALVRAGVVADSQVATFHQALLTPLLHWTGIVRFPVFFEDDIFFDYRTPDLSLDRLPPTLFAPGLKVLNFHPTFVACNTPSRAFHEAAKAKLFGSAAPGEGVVWTGRGTANVFDELLDRIHSAGFEFVAFERLVDDVLQFLRAAPWYRSFPIGVGPPV